MSSLSTFPASAGQDVFTSSSTASHQLGEKMAIGPREFRYCKAGGTALVPGKLQQAQAEDTADQGLAVAAAAVGAKTVVTTSTLTTTANQYAGGWVCVTITPGQGYSYRIASHPAASAAVLTITLEDPILVALTTDSRIDLVANPYSAVVVNPTTATSSPVGVAVYPVAASEFGWIQTKGPCPVLVDDQTVVVGTNVAASNQAAGAVEPATGVQALVGRALTGGATTDYVMIDLNLS